MAKAVRRLEDGNVWTEYRRQPSDALGRFLRGAQTDKAGNRIHSIMRSASPGDLVVHFIKENKQQFIAGYSYVKKNWKTQILSNKKMYRIELRGFVDFGKHRPLLHDFIEANTAKLEEEITNLKQDKKPHYYPFALSEGEVRLYQKGYFSRASGSLRAALLVELSRLGRNRPAVSQTDLDDEFASEVKKSLTRSPDERRRRLAEAAKTPLRELRQVWVFKRNPDVVAEVLSTAAGCQEGSCKNPIPFRKIDTQPFLEVHHVVPLSDGGEDTVENAVALCPNCHRKRHYELRPRYSKTISQI